MNWEGSVEEAMLEEGGEHEPIAFTAADLK